MPNIEIECFFFFSFPNYTLAGFGASKSRIQIIYLKKEWGPRPDFDWVVIGHFSDLYKWLKK